MNTRACDIRALTNDDYDAVIRLATELDVEERYRRFLTRYPSYIAEWALALTTPPQPGCVSGAQPGCALGAFESGELIGIADYSTTATGDCAEVAVLVAHEQHQRGVGTLLLQELGRRAMAAGLHCLTADVLADNQPMLQVIRDAGWPVTGRRDGEIVRIRVDLDRLRTDVRR